MGEGLPSDEHAEKALVSRYLVVKAAPLRSCPLQPEHFVHGRHSTWWRKAQSLSGTDWTPWDLGLTDRDVDDYSSQGLAARSSYHAEAQRRLQECYSLRTLERRCAAFLDTLRGKGTTPKLSELTGELRALVAEVEAGTPKRARDHHAVTYDLMTWLMKPPDKPTTIPFPWPLLTQHYSGWARGKLHVIAGRSSEHKTTFARQSAMHAAQQGFDALFITLEDSDTEIAARSVAQCVPRLDTRTLYTGLPKELKNDAALALVMADVSKHVSQPWTKKLRYLDTPLTISSLVSSLRSEAARGLDIAVVDFIQLVNADRGQRRDPDFWRQLYAEVAALAKELDIALVCTSQIGLDGTRASEDSREPRGSDMLYGGALKQSAYAVLMIWRAPNSNRVTVKVEKWKSGAPGEYNFTVDPAHDTLHEQRPRDDEKFLQN